MNSEAQKFFLYARKSSESEDKQMASIDAQIAELDNLVKKEGIKVVQIFTESKSAKAPGRPVFNDMIAQIKEGKADGIICWKLNRLARNPIDGGEISWLLQQDIVKHILTPGKSYYPTDNVLLMAVELGMANQFLRDLSVDVKRGLKTKAEQGWLPGPALPGYVNTPDKLKGYKIVDIDEDNFTLVKRMFREVLDCKHSAKQVLDIATNDWGVRKSNGKKITRSAWYSMLHNPFYYGEFEYGGQTYKGSHEPMITKQEYDKIQIILGGKQKNKRVTHSFPFTGVMNCGECGRTVTAENRYKKQKSGKVHHYVHYHCTAPNKTVCSQGVVHGKDIHKQLTKETASIEIPEDFVQWSLGVIKQENADMITSRNEVIRKQRRLYDACVTKIDNLIDLCTDGTISADDLKRKREPLEKEKKHLHSIMTNTDNSVSSWLDEVEERLAVAETAKRKFENMKDDTAMKKLIRSFASDLTLKDGIVSVKLHKPLAEVKVASKILRDENLVVRTAENRLSKRKNTPSYEVFPDLLRG